MRWKNLVIKDIKQINFNGYKKYLVKDTCIKSITEDAIKYIEIYLIAENPLTKEDQKLKIRVTGAEFIMIPVKDEEWEHCCNNKQ